MQLKPFSEPSPFAVDIIIQRGALNDKQNDSVRRAKFLIFALAFWPFKVEHDYIHMFGGETSVSNNVELLPSHHPPTHPHTHFTNWWRSVFG